jgi:large subunit ribosomal protein L16
MKRVIAIRSKGGNYVTFGEYGLQATTTSWITSRQIESARIAMTRFMKFYLVLLLQSNLLLHLYQHPYVLLKVFECKVYVAGVNEEVAREALRLASHKLPVKTKFVKREELGGETNES